MAIALGGNADEAERSVIVECQYCGTDVKVPFGHVVVFERTLELRSPPAVCAAWATRIGARPVWSEGPLHVCRYGIPE